MFNKIYESIKNFIKENYKGLIIILVIFLLFSIKLPYSIYTPGGTINLDARIKIKDAYETDGSFNMAYVSVVRGSAPFLLLAKILPDWDIMKESDITLENENLDELFERERLYLEESIDSAIINAYKTAGKYIKITKVNNAVSYITKEANTDIKVGDNLVSVNDIDINSLNELKNMIETLDVGEVVNVKVIRDEKTIETTATIYETPAGNKIGISIITTYEYEENPKVDVKSKKTEAGSSGGLMMSLDIYNKLTETDITKGKKIVGTGTIDIDGNVGEIGGVKYKLMGAVKNKADIFICPKENYEEASTVAKEKNYDIKIISASTFEEILKKLEEI